MLDELARLAPLTAVRGNNDTGPWAERLRDFESVKLGEVLVCVIHDLAQLHIDPQPAGIRVVVSGHSHRPMVEERAGVLFVNPGSAGPRRFNLPIAIGELTVTGTAFCARIVDLREAFQFQTLIGGLNSLI